MSFISWMYEQFPVSGITRMRIKRKLKFGSEVACISRLICCGSSKGMLSLSPKNVFLLFLLTHLLESRRNWRNFRDDIKWTIPYSLAGIKYFVVSQATNRVQFPILLVENSFQMLTFVKNHSHNIYGRMALWKSILVPIDTEIQ